MKRTLAFLCLITMVAGLLHNAPAQTPEEVQLMRQAMPETPSVEPGQPRKLLVFTLCKGYAHSSVPYAAKALEVMGEETGAFEATVTDDPAVFAPERLKVFDAVCFDNTTGTLFEDPALKQSLLDFVRGGKGVVGIHAATDCFYDWPEFGEMMGGYFDGHPWGAGDTVTIKIDDPNHPVCRAFLGEGFSITDEIYQLRNPYSREKLRVLLSLDTAKTDMTKNGIKRKDGDFAISWIREYGKGRVFYCSLGHNHDIFWNPLILEHYLDGIQYALGDLEADATPSAELPPGHREQSQAALDRNLIDIVIGDMKTFTFGGNTRVVRRMDEMVSATQDAPNERAVLAAKLAGVLSSDATYACKRQVCKYLYRIGTAKQAGELAPLLQDDELAGMARYALEAIPGPEAQEALLDALASPEGRVRIGLINTLGMRGEPSAVKALAKLVRHDDEATAQAAVMALGRIGGMNASYELARARSGVSDALRPCVADAFLMCAGQLLAEGDEANAATLYESAYEPSAPARIRTVALLGLVKARGDDALPRVLAAFQADEPAMWRAAASGARTLESAEATEAFTRLLPLLNSNAQALLIHALADRGDSAALDAVTACAESEDGAVRVAVLEAMAALGGASCVPLLAERAVLGGRVERETARKSLARLSGEGVEEAIVDALESAPAPQRRELAACLGARNATASVPALLETARRDEPEVREAALRSLGMLAGPGEVDGLLGILIEAEDQDVRDGARSALIAAARKAPGDADATEPVRECLDELGWRDKETKAELLGVLGGIGAEPGLPVLRRYARKRNKTVREAAIRGLAQWPNASAAEDLARAARKTRDDRLRALALRGLLDQLREPEGLPAERRVELLSLVLRLAPADALKLSAISVLADVKDPRAFGLLLNCSGEEALEAEAVQGLNKLAPDVLKTVARPNTAASANAIDSKPDTRWNTGKPQEPGQWFILDLGAVMEVERLVLDCTASPDDYPRAYEVYLAEDEGEWDGPVAQGDGSGPVTPVEFGERDARFIKVEQTGSAEGGFWSIHELRVEGGGIEP